MTQRKGTYVSTTLTPPKNELYESRARLLGYIWSIMLTRPELSVRKFDVLEKIFNPAFRHSKISVFFNSLSEPVAYVVWAFITEEVGHRIASTGLVDLHLSEWNEGEQFWIIDCAAKQGYFSGVIKDHLLRNFANRESVFFFKYRFGKFICKEVSREVFERLASRP